jgi:D-threo-aldose 1-dehydrogenase
MNQWQMLYDFAVEGNFDCFLLAGRYTLLEQQPARKFLPRCEEKGIRVVIGGPYNSGILATGAVEGAYYNYLPATPEVMERTRRIQEVCARHDVPLQSAALQFPFGHPCIASVIPGARSTAEIDANVAFFEEEIPVDFWRELRDLSLIAAEAPLPISEN